MPLISQETIDEVRAVSEWNALREAELEFADRKATIRGRLILAILKAQIALDELTELLKESDNADNS